jgi:hypothetical protein
MLDFDQNRYAEAEPLLHRALALKEKAQGPDSPETASVIRDLALTCRKLGRHDESERLYQPRLWPSGSG